MKLIFLSLSSTLLSSTGAVVSKSRSNHPPTTIQTHSFPEIAQRTADAPVALSNHHRAEKLSLGRAGQGGHGHSGVHQNLNQTALPQAEREAEGEGDRIVFASAKNLAQRQKNPEAPHPSLISRWALKSCEHWPPGHFGVQFTYECTPVHYTHCRVEYTNYTPNSENLGALEAQKVACREDEGLRVLAFDGDMEEEGERGTSTYSAKRGKNLRIVTECCKVPRMASGAYPPTETSEGSCVLSTERPVETLSLHTAKCESGQVLRGWHLSRSNCGGWWDMKMKSECVHVPNPFVTNCNEVLGKRIRYLDDHFVSCDSGLLRGWRLQQGECAHSEAQIAFECAPGIHGNCKSLTTDWQPGYTGTVEYLDRHPIQCPKDQSNRPMGLKRMGMWADGFKRKVKFEYECCEVYTNERTPTVTNSPCVAARGKTLESLERLPVECSDRQVLTGWSLVGDCGTSDGMKMRAECLDLK
uniref:SRCR domain-containing protein n=1 Tax=Chromera velia CCMP2878 TaxID=1169474 RepID=A0A0G4FEL2_9ALVE|eukprot:Cvel_16632.t1-p1 / transcript=Cvel_16632.t1 / gene=Cvel_16632 / organism=Chromera_velia_CCMP2878 / gene_product=hypothetical protein / transcript_product=hypothetical protein / location=Cvel_scaffold1289:29860-32539(+) / protein_length=469 / sequence_SO=supercontig / SO=protein_coding / is_pseudo=false